MDPALGPKRSGHRHKPQQKASEGKSSTYRALVVTCFCIAEWSLYLYLPKKAKLETAVSKGHTATKAET